MNTILLLLVLTTSTLVLRSGDRIDVDGAIQEKNGVITFRSAGALYSMPLDEVDIEASNKTGSEIEVVADAENVTDADTDDESDEVRRLRVSPEERKRLLEELEKNHAGTPPTKQRILEEPLRLKTDAQEAEQKRDEWSWRREARTYEDAVARAKEELALLEMRIEELRAQIHGFMSLGYKPAQFTYQTSQLEQALAEVPRAKLEVERAQRDYDRFREDARKQGVLPGWLR